MRCRRRASPPFFFAVRPAAGPGRRTPARPSTGHSRSRPAPRRPAPQPAGRKRPRCRPLPQRLAARGTGGSGCHRAAVTWPRGLGHVAAAIDPHCGPYGAQKPPGSSRGADGLTGLGGAPESPLPRPPGCRRPRPRGQTPTVSSAAENVPPSVGKRGLVSRLITRSYLWIRHTRPEACGDKPAPPIEQPHGKRQIHGRR